MTDWVNDKLKRFYYEHFRRRDIIPPTQTSDGCSVNGWTALAWIAFFLAVTLGICFLL